MLSTSVVDSKLHSHWLFKIIPASIVRTFFVYSYVKIQKSQKTLAQGQRNLKSLQLLQLEVCLSLETKIPCQQHRKVDGTGNTHFPIELPLILVSVITPTSIP